MKQFEKKKRSASPTLSRTQENENVHSYMLLPGTAWWYCNKINEVPYTRRTVCFAEDDAVE